MVRQWQELIYDNRYSHIDLAGSPDFASWPKPTVSGLRATTKEEAQRAWAEAMETPGPVLVESAVAEKGENVYPMVTQGSHNRSNADGDA